MKKFRVTHPITGTVVVEVAADTAEQAIEVAPDAWFEMTPDEQAAAVDWEWTNPITRGNVFYGVQNEADVEEISEEENGG